MHTLQGYIDRSTGKAELTFLANFMFTAGPLYSVRPQVQISQILQGLDTKSVSSRDFCLLPLFRSQLHI